MTTSTAQIHPWLNKESAAGEMSPEEVGEAAGAAIAITLFFWFLIVAFIVAIAARYWWWTWS
jgi:hypothetical protein